MNENKQKPNLTLAPSFGRPIPADDIPSGGESDGGDEFEFEFSVGSPAMATGGEPADEIFSNGRILPVYPVFNRSLLEKSDPDPVNLRSGSTSSTSSAESLEIDAPYCAWAPRSAPQSPDRGCKKSSSTGSGSGPASSKRWSVRDLVGGRRSHSDGKEKFVFLNSGSDVKTGSGSRPPKGGAKEMDMVTAHRLFYGKDKGKEKRSFLPYRPELVGLFANSRSHHHHPFNF